MREQMTEETQEYKAELTSDCICEIYDEETGESKLDEYGYPERPDYCYGCYQEEVFQFYDNFLPIWLERRGLKDDGKVMVIAESIRWNRTNGAGFVDVSEIHKVMEIDGDFKNKFTIKGNELYAVRYSHDEPTGTGRWTFTPAESCSQCDGGIPAEVYEDENGICANCKEYE
jgi:hypothetical protein